MPEGTPVLQALYEGRREDAEALARDAVLDVFEASALGRTKKLARLLEAGPHRACACSADGFTPLHLAAFFGHPDAARVLLDHGAGVDEPAQNAKLAAGATPLHGAAASRQLEVARLLLERGADPNARQASGHSVLDAALANGDDALAELLRAHGAE